MTGVVNIRLAVPDDAESIAAAEKAYIDCPWTEEQVLGEINNRDAVFITAEIDGNFAGYLSGVIAADECELSNVAVAEQYRRRGVAKSMFEDFFVRLAARGVKEVFLLVRDTNTAATELYKSLGFGAVGLRKNYYQGHNAVVMRKALR